MWIVDETAENCSMRWGRRRNSNTEEIVNVEERLRPYREEEIDPPIELAAVDVEGAVLQVTTIAVDRAQTAVPVAGSDALSELRSLSLAESA